MQTSEEVFASLALAAQDSRRVQGATHKFYPYPARFSPLFVQAVIEQFTQPGDLVFDPFVGGGTTLVEAMRLGRDAVGFDINELATFVSEVKTTILSPATSETIRKWAIGLPSYINMQTPAPEDKARRDGGYFKNLETGGLWRHRKAIQQALDATQWLPSQEAQNFVRCALLRTSQTALDGKRSPPTISVFRQRLLQNLSDMLDDMADVRSEIAKLGSVSSSTVVKRSAAMSHTSTAFIERKPKLILTSPPYPGVHVLYHRWQINGRRETAAPYWIANKLDGDGEQYYTLGRRHQKGLTTYFSNLENVFRSVAQICDDTTTIVQVVAFSEPEWQLERYLEALTSAGLREIETTN